MDCCSKDKTQLQQARRDFIQAMRSVANSVAVVTTDGAAGRHGATVSSFCSVSADPPSVLVCLHDDSRIAQYVRENGCFCINVLPQEMSDTADRFAGRNDDMLKDRFDDLDHAVGQTGCAGIDGAVAFHCVLTTQHLSGSHRVIIGNVEQVNGTFTRPLTYLDGEYRPWLY